jgi:hypothetical protein
MGLDGACRDLSLLNGDHESQNLATALSLIRSSLKGGPAQLGRAVAQWVSQ